MDKHISSHMSYYNDDAIISYTNAIKSKISSEKEYESQSSFSENNLTMKFNLSQKQ
jgi:hypothetical protein